MSAVSGFVFSGSFSRSGSNCADLLSVISSICGGTVSVLSGEGLDFVVHMAWLDNIVTLNRHRFLLVSDSFLELTPRYSGSLVLPLYRSNSGAPPVPVGFVGCYAPNKVNRDLSTLFIPSMALVGVGGHEPVAHVMGFLVGYVCCGVAFANGLDADSLALHVGNGEVMTPNQHHPCFWQFVSPGLSLQQKQDQIDRPRDFSWRRRHLRRSKRVPKAAPLSPNSACSI